MNILKIVAEVLAAFVIIGTFLPFIRTDHWWIRIFDFPRAQLLFLGVIVLVLFILFYQRLVAGERILGILLISGLIVQCCHIYPYTTIQKLQVKAAKDGREPIKIFVANVLQDNTGSLKLLEQIKALDPDIVLLTEMDQRWTNEMRPLEQELQHLVLHPLSNTYGMNLYSRFPVIDPEIRKLIDPNIPSIRTELELPSGRSILFYGVHPLPPGIKHPHNEKRQDSDQRDAELVVIAKEVAEEKLPIMIAGDFNDVAWSHTTRLFQRTSRLLDPRVGRGFF
ncbi:MAG: endonuclease/exonuclease/phosphatase family protein, partial [Bacteroidota bacterium]|nr:endonuclease/exonuclease/phosphatase family protein [Bacteroidota bacterium]